MPDPRLLKVPCQFPHIFLLFIMRGKSSGFSNMNIIIVSTILTWMILEQSPLDPQRSLGSDPLMTTEGVLLAHCFTFSPWGISPYGSYYVCFCVKVGVYSGVSVSPFSSYAWNTEGKKREVSIAVETRYVNKLSDILQEKFHAMQNWMET